MGRATKRAVVADRLSTLRVAVFRLPCFSPLHCAAVSSGPPHFLGNLAISAVHPCSTDAGGVDRFVTPVLPRTGSTEVPPAHRFGRRVEAMATRKLTAQTVHALKPHLRRVDYFRTALLRIRRYLFQSITAHAPRARPDAPVLRQNGSDVYGETFWTRL